MHSGVKMNKGEKRKYSKIYNSRPEVKERRKVYNRIRNQREDVKAWRREYMRKYRKRFCEKNEKKIIFCHISFPYKFEF